jgi:hypothetical protein
MQTLRSAGLKRPYAMDWIRATTATKDATISDANLAAIMGGMLVFRDPIGIGAPAILGRVIAFGLVAETAGLDPDEDLAVTRLGSGDVLDAQRLGEVMNDGSFHRAFLYGYGRLAMRAG